MADFRSFTRVRRSPATPMQPVVDPDPASRPLRKTLRDGRQGRGVRLDGVKLDAPLDVDAAAA